MKTLINNQSGHIAFIEGSKRPYKITKNERTVSFSTLESAIAAQAKYDAEELAFAQMVQEARRAI